MLLSGCGGAVEPGQLPGTYRNDETGGEIQLRSDRTFSATDVATSPSSDPADFSGRWEYIDNQNFVYLSLDENGGLGNIYGIQLYMDGEGTVYFRSDPDGPPSLVLTESSTPENS